MIALAILFNAFYKKRNASSEEYKWFEEKQTFLNYTLLNVVILVEVVMKLQSTADKNAIKTRVSELLQKFQYTFSRNEDITNFLLLCEQREESQNLVLSKNVLEIKIVDNSFVSAFKFSCYFIVSRF